MGAIPWQIVHQNSKNSTNCKPPDAILTAFGSVASRLGPREVATGSAVASRDCVDPAALRVEISNVGLAGGRVALAFTATGVAEVAAEHAASKTVSKLNLSKVESFQCGKKRRSISL